MTAEQVKAIITEVMQEQQVNLLQVAATTTESIIEAKLTEKESKDKKIASTRLKYPGNQKQLDFQQQVLQIWDRTERALDMSNVEKAKENIEAGRKLTLSRIKLIKLADREGWGAAYAYETDDLVSDSADEKRIRKAISTANYNKRQKRLKEREEKSNDLEGQNKRQKFDKSKNLENVTCWKCGKEGTFFLELFSQQHGFFVVRTIEQK